MLKYLLISCVFFNVFAVLAITAGAKIYHKNGKLVIVPILDYWISTVAGNCKYNDPQRLLTPAKIFKCLSLTDNIVAVVG